MAWKCKECGKEVVLSESWETGYICINPNCKNNKEYSNFVEDIAEWEED